MSTVRFLGDAHIRRSLAEALWHEESTLEFFFVGDEGFPPFDATDPELIRFAEVQKLSIVTADRRTMPDHMRDHLGAGGHTWGIFLIKRGATWSALMDNLLLVWSASQAEEWMDRLERLPW